MEQKKITTIKRNACGFLFITPLILYFLIFQLAPMIIAFVLSFTGHDDLDNTIWVGLDNYIAVLTNKDNLYPYYWKSLTVTLEYILLTVPLSIFSALVVSALLNTKIKGERFFKTAFYIPSVTVGVAIMALWKYMLDPDFGLLHQLFGTETLFLREEGVNLVTLAVISVWGGLGYNVLIMLSAMKNIDRSLYEAASIDGASGIKQFFTITIPGVMPTVFFFLITGIIGGFQAFDQMYLMTGVGKNHSTYTYIYGVYEQSITFGEHGIGSAMSFILFAMILVLTVIQFRMLPQESLPLKKRRKK